MYKVVDHLHRNFPSSAKDSLIQLKANVSRATNCRHFYMRLEVKPAFAVARKNVLEIISHVYRDRNPMTRRHNVHYNIQNLLIE